MHLKKIVFVLILAVKPYTDSLAQIPQNNPHLLESLENARIVLLGEPDHYSIPEMHQKVAWVKYLHDSLDFKWLAFESSLYDMDRANRAYLQGAEVREALYSGIFPIWHGNEAIDALIHFLESLEDRETLQLLGFDSQINSGVYTRDTFTEDLQSFLSHQKIKIPDEFMTRLQKEIESFDGDQYTTSDSFQTGFLGDIVTMIRELEASPSYTAGFWRRNLISIHGLLYDYHHNKLSEKVDDGSFKAYYTNLRDSLMAENLLWFLNNHPHEKIIGWGASFHFANDLSLLSHPDDNTLSRTRPMGYYLKKWLGDKVLIIGFSDLKKIKDAEGVVLEENPLYQQELAVIDFDSIKDEDAYSSLLGLGQNQIFPFGKWQKVMDYGITFDTEAHFKYEGMVADASNNHAIPFVHVKVAGSHVGTITNEKGQFRLLLPPDMEDEHIDFSSVGYQPLEVQQHQLQDTILLTPDVQYLQSIDVTAKREMPIDLLKKVAENFRNRALIDDYQLDAYYYSWWTLRNQPRDTAVNEAALRLIYKNGYTNDQKIHHTIVNRRQVHGKRYLVPWPIHTLGMADFRPGLGLLHPKMEKHFTVDSIKYQLSATDTLATYFYSTDKKAPKIVGTSAPSYRGELTFSSRSLEVKRKSIYLSFHGNGLKEASYHIEYASNNGVIIPDFAWMAYEGNFEGAPSLGKEAIRITAMLDQIDEIDNPIIELKDAPYSPAFWENYNRMKD
jgi:hypothetical protein